MSEMEEILEVPDELKDLILEYKVCIQCRDEAIRSVFRAKRAISYGMQGEKARKEFWKKVDELYPGLTEFYSYHYDTERLELKGKDE